MKQTNPVLSIFLLTLSFSILLIESFTNNAAHANNSASEKWLSEQQVIADLNLLKDAYSRMHPGYDRYTSVATLNKAWQSIIEDAKLSKGMSVGDFYLNIQKALVLIRCDHTKANLSKAMKEERNTRALYLPFYWTWVENRAFVTMPDSDNNLQKFDEILSIDGQSIQSLVAQVTPYIPYDGFTSWSTNAGIASSLEFHGGAVDHFGALIWQIEPTVSVKIKRKNGSEITYNLDRINYKDYSALGTSITARNFKNAVSFELINKHTAYLRIDTFVNYREPVDPKDIYDPIFKKIKEANIGTLVVDLRKNGGGSTDASSGLLSNLISKKMPFKTDMYAKTLDFQDLREHLWTWDKRALNPTRIGFSKNDDNTYSLRSWFTEELDKIKPAKYAFTGRIIALTSNSNSSGSTNFLSVLNSNEDVTLIGEKTGGSAEGVTAGLLFTLTLPESKITTRIPFFRFKNNVQEFEFGMGLRPDVYAPMTADAFVQGKDPAFEAAISLSQ